MYFIQKKIKEDGTIELIKLARLTNKLYIYHRENKSCLYVFYSYKEMMECENIDGLDQYIYIEDTSDEYIQSLQDQIKKLKKELGIL